MSKKLIIANWKMNPSTTAQAGEILARTDDFLQGLEGRHEPSMVICPPFVFLDEVQAMLQTGRLRESAVLGAQDIAAKDDGALTGEVSGPQLVQSGVRYVIIGHSERRYKLGEDDATVNAKLAAALRNDLVPVVCIGERSRDGNFRRELRGQIVRTFDGLDEAKVARCIVAYEPVWAISTTPGARPDTPESALQSVELIDEVLHEKYGVINQRYLYGGSVTGDNAGEYLAVPAFNGVLVGGASVRPDDFAAILMAEVNRMTDEERP